MLKIKPVKPTKLPTTITDLLLWHPLPLSRAPHVKFQPTHVADQAYLGQCHGNHREEVAPRHHGLHECLVGRVYDVTVGFLGRFHYFAEKEFILLFLLLLFSICSYFDLSQKTFSFISNLVWILYLKAILVELFYI